MGETVTILGAGKMGEALLSGLLRMGMPASQLVFSEKHDQRCKELSARFGVDSDVPRAAVQRADVVLLAVKPQDLAGLLDEISDSVKPDALVISIVAGVHAATIEDRLASSPAVVRVMPNTPVLVDEGMSAIAPGANANEAHLQRTEALLAPVGKVVRVTESQLDAVTAVSGSGPAYFFYVVEAMVEAGVQLGLTRDLAHELVIQTAVGAAVMMRDSGDDPAKLRENVTSPGGTTAAAIRSLEEHGARVAWMAALEAARDRSRELASGQ